MTNYVVETIAWISDGNATKSSIDNSFEFLRLMDWKNVCNDEWFYEEEKYYNYSYL